MDPDIARGRLAAERADASALIGSMRARLSAVVDAAVDEHADDEHDPEGSTLAFERGQLVAQIERSTERVAEVDAALARLGDGTYGRCLDCGGDIAEVRLEALPATGVCITCASRRHRSRW
ncbi:MAG: TraR/DksA C4-type zinc finger protein [Corynebacteriales bacterium]|uniref:TraR/DksA family transcriptional regulator n=1 Tax=Williamsia herbipolensis TaxID=1603258 RepID=A0AAU4K0Q0_9NOCA|nr:TraR/DksA C4-type zinc finger protein [Williamsia herbipolensis]MCX6469092.1 TraR/DksA C4-type zinc finger protein [Mycobacteriales bacterium]